MVSMLGTSFLKGDIYIPNYDNIEDNLDRLQAYVPQSSDYFLCSYPKSGTHWVHEIMHMLLTGKAEYNSDPMCNMESGCYGPSSVDENQNQPRILQTHLPFQMLPEAILRQKIVYIMRNPRDQLVSLYHHHQGLKWSPTLTFKEFFVQMISEPDRVEYGDWFRNAYKWWLRYHNTENVLFLFYEDLISDLEKGIMKIVEFYHLTHLPTEFIKEVTHKTRMEQMKTEKPVGEWFAHWHKKSFSICRKGKNGSWLTYFTEEMNQMFNKFCEQKTDNPVRYLLGVVTDTDSLLESSSTAGKPTAGKSTEGKSTVGKSTAGKSTAGKSTAEQQK